jgi:CRP-like cAMP-binding protein
MIGTSKLSPIVHAGLTLVKVRSFFIRATRRIGFILSKRARSNSRLRSKSGERRIEADRIEPGGVLGWSWLFAPYEWQFTARALTQTRAIFFYGTVLRERCETDPSLGFELFKRMGQEMVKRLQSARRRLLEAETTGFSPVGAEHAIYGA